MARYTGPRCKLCRREGEKLFLKGIRCLTKKCAFERRPYPPGIHGPRKKGAKLTIYGMQLREKQKVKRIYGVLEKQFRRFFEIARKMPGNTGENLLILLERRLDNVVFRAGFAHTRSQARQFVRHGHILVNGKRIDIPSYLVKTGDIIIIDEKMRGNYEINSAIEFHKQLPKADWLEVDYNNYACKVIREPQRIDVTHPINERLIVELYSK
ncbi:MAG: 30S ribosomal protein S4 [candidate division WOR-3 bacterium]